MPFARSPLNCLAARAPSQKKGRPPSRKERRTVFAEVDSSWVLANVYQYMKIINKHFMHTVAPQKKWKKMEVLFAPFPTRFFWHGLDRAYDAVHTPLYTSLRSLYFSAPQRRMTDSPRPTPLTWIDRTAPHMGEEVLGHGIKCAHVLFCFDSPSLPCPCATPIPMPTRAPKTKKHSQDCLIGQNKPRRVAAGGGGGLFFPRSRPRAQGVRFVQLCFVPVRSLQLQSFPRSEMRSSFFLLFHV